MPKKLRVLMLAAVVVVVVGACGSSEDAGSSKQRPQPDAANTEEGSSSGTKRPTPVETVRVAYRETAAEQTARTSFEMTMTGPSADPGGADRSDSMTMTVTGEGAVDFSGEASIFSLQMAGMGEMEVRQVGDVVYTKMPEAFAAQMSGGKPWVALDAEEVYGRSGGGLGGMRGGAASDPARQLEYLRGVSDSVEKVGTDTVRGVRTTRYKATINAQELAAGLDGEAREKYEGTLRQAGMEEMPVEIWLDDQNRVRRYAMDVETDAPQGDGMRIEVLAEYYDFGAAVDVQAPPPNQTTDGSRLVASRASA